MEFCGGGSLQDIYHGILPYTTILISSITHSLLYIILTIYVHVLYYINIYVHIYYI